MEFEAFEGESFQSSMQAPKKGPRLCRNDEKWEAIRRDIHALYMVENRTLARTMQEIQAKHNFKASVRKWKMKLKEWGYEKHLSEPDMKTILAKARKRKEEEGKDTTFFYHGQEIPAAKIENFKRRRTVKGSEVASASAETPEPVTYSTPMSYSTPVPEPDDSLASSIKGNPDIILLLSLAWEWI